MKNIHVVPTPNPSRLYKHIDNPLVITYNPIEDRKFGRWCINQNIYITSEEDIKIGDYYLCKLSMSLLKCIGDEYFNNVDEKKIVLTTDQDLIADGVQDIDDEFLEWFVENPSCEIVEVDESPITSDPKGYKSFYKIIIPKEEVLLQSSIDGKVIWGEPKQETLEEAFDRIFDSIDYTEFDFTSFEQGAKWRQEQILDFLYSEITERRNYSASKMCEKVVKFIEQFKKK